MIDSAFDDDAGIVSVRDGLVRWIRDWFDRNGADSPAVVGISGGKDSTVVAGLCVMALGRDRVIGVMMPNGRQPDIGDSIRVVKALGIRSMTIDVGGAFGSLSHEIGNAIGSEMTVQASVNLAPRIRMSALYAVSQCFGGRVVNTSNYSEYMLGYFTKHGDGAGDLFPLKNLTKTEVVAIGKSLGMFDDDLIDKSPADGLTGRSDEDAFGFTYGELDGHLRGHSGASVEISRRISASAFKRRPPEEFIP